MKKLEILNVREQLVALKAIGQGNKRLNTLNPKNFLLSNEIVKVQNVI